MTEIFFFENEHLCGATLIHPEWVLTAGHCAFAFGDDDFLLVANAPYYDHDDPDPQAEILLADSVIYHPDYDGESGPDIALFHLSQPAFTTPVELIDPDDMVDLSTGSPALTLGWGVNDSLVIEFSDTLLAADVVLFDYDTCQTLFEDASYDFFALNGTPNLICAGYFEGTDAAGAGNGDSGGPLLVDVNGTWKQIGVVYGGEGNFVLSNYPGVYTSILGNLSWIEGTIAGFGSTGLHGIDSQPFEISYDHFTDRVTIKGESQIGAYRLIDLTGQVLDSSQSQESMIQIDMSAYRSRSIILRLDDHQESSLITLH